MLTDNRIFKSKTTVKIAIGLFTFVAYGNN